MTEVANHLWQSTAFASAATLVAWALRNNEARVRYWLWLAASLKFLVPFSLLVSLGTRVEVPVPRTAVPAVAVEQLTTTFSPAGALPLMTEAADGPRWPKALAAVWFAGTLFLLARWLFRWVSVRSALRHGSRLLFQAPIPVISSPAGIEPGVFGIFHPVLLLPSGISNRLSGEELRAILAHEIAHVRRRDNLTAALHMLVEALFWFHPLVWWIGARLVEERERACDEEVLREGSEPQVYAQGVLNVCKYFVESPLPCAAGVTGADLKKRIEEIMTNRIAVKLSAARRLALAGAALAVVASPVAIGLLNAPPSQAQSKPEESFEVASIRPADVNPAERRVGIRFMPGGGIDIMGMGVKELIAFAYGLPCQGDCDMFISGAPGWASDAAYDIRAKSPAADPAADVNSPASRRAMQELMRARLRTLLKERFQLVMREETKEMPAFALVAAKSGAKLKPSEAGGPSKIADRRGQLTAENVSMDQFCRNLSNAVRRPVVDKTGLTGQYSFTLEFTPERLAPGGPADSSSPDSAPSLFTALQEQLGLKLESTKAPVKTYAIEKLEKPSEN